MEKVKDREYERLKADPCLYYIWKDGRLSAMLSWVDDIIALGTQNDVDQVEHDLNDEFVCNSEGELKEYVGRKIDVMQKKDGLAIIKFLQPVLIKKLEDGFDVPSGRPLKTPAVAGRGPDIYNTT